MFKDLYKHSPKEGEQQFSEDFNMQVESTKNVYPNLQEISLLENNEHATLGRNFLDEILNSTLDNVTSVSDLNDSNS